MAGSAVVRDSTGTNCVPPPAGVWMVTWLVSLVGDEHVGLGGARVKGQRNVITRN